MPDIFRQATSILDQARMSSRARPGTGWAEVFSRSYDPEGAGHVNDILDGMPAAYGQGIILVSLVGFLDAPGGDYAVYNTFGQTEDHILLRAGAYAARTRIAWSFGFLGEAYPAPFLGVECPPGPPGQVSVTVQISA